MGKLQGIILNGKVDLKMWWHHSNRDPGWSPGVTVLGWCDYTEVAQRHFFVTMEQCCVLIVMVVTRLHRCYKKYTPTPKIAGRNINNLRYTNDTTIMTESKQQLKNLLMNMKEESGKAGLKLSIQKAKIMSSGSITSRQIDGKKWKQWQTLFTWDSKSQQIVTAAVKLKDACSLEEKLWQT